MKRNNIKKTGYILVLSIMLCIISGCGKSSQEIVPTVRIAYQSSIGYSPLVVMKEKNMIEECYDGQINVEWIEMKNGAEINEGLIAGQIDVGTMGVPVAVTGIMVSDMYKIAFGLSSQPYSLLTNSPNINSISDIGPTNQIAITNINSQPHVLLAKACKNTLGDARALDENLTVLSNADGYSAILTGAVDCHIVISPYNFMELKDENADIHEIDIDEDIWPAHNTTLVGVVNSKFKEKNPKAYEAVIDAVNMADNFILTNPKESSEIVAKDYDASSEEIMAWMGDNRSNYEIELHGVMDFVEFMLQEGFIDDAPSSLEEIAFENVIGD